MLVLDFGNRLLEHRRRGAIFIGTTSVGIRDCFWELRNGRDVVITAESVDCESFNKLVTPMMRDQSIEDADPDMRQGFLRLRFSNNIAIDLDITNRWNSDMAIAEIGLSNGAYVEILPSGELQIGQDRDLLRLNELERRSQQRP